jgi:hypothetical protein
VDTTAFYWAFHWMADDSSAQRCQLATATVRLPGRVSSMSQRATPSPERVLESPEPHLETSKR